MGGKKGNQSKKGVGKRLSQSKGVKLPKASKKSSKASLNKKVSGLKKYNRLVKILRGNKPVKLAEFREIQQQAKGIYPSFKKVAISKITAKAVKGAVQTKATTKPKSDTILIKASQIPKSELEIERVWWMIGDEMYNLHEKYPEVRLVIQTPNNQVIIEENELLDGGYSSSKLADFVELLRVEDLDSSETFTGLATIDKKGKKEFAFFGLEGIDFPEDIPKAEQQPPPKVKKEIKKREKKLIDEKKKKQDLKEIKKKELPKVKEKKDRITDKQSDNLTKQLELVERLFDKGVLDKNELKTKMDEILSKYKKGGII